MMRTGWSRRDDAPPTRDHRLVVLCYHAVSRDWDSVLAVRPEALETQVESLVRRGYAPRTLSDALSTPGREKTVVVTFDDAYRSVREQALPVLSGLGVPGTVFVPTDLAGRAGLMTEAIAISPASAGPDREMRCMAWQELRELADAGWEVGSHTVSHADLTSVDRATAAVELRRSRGACEEEMGRRCRSVAYPFGAWNRAVVEEAAAAGYEYGVTLGSRLLEPLSAGGPLEIPRDGVYGTTRGWQFGIATSAPIRRLRAGRFFPSFRA